MYTIHLPHAYITGKAMSKRLHHTIAKQQGLAHSKLSGVNCPAWQIWRLDVSHEAIVIKYHPPGKFHEIAKRFSFYKLPNLGVFCPVSSMDQWVILLQWRISPPRILRESSPLRYPRRNLACTRPGGQWCHLPRSWELPMRFFEYLPTINFQLLILVLRKVNCIHAIFVKIYNMIQYVKIVCT